MPGLSPAEILKLNRERAARMAQEAGAARTRKLLERAQRELSRRITQVAAAGGQEPFSLAQMRVTLAQIKDTMRGLKDGMRSTITEHGRKTAEDSATGTLAYLEQAEQAYRGINQPLDLDRARIVDRAVAGANSSILHRLEGDPEHPGILERYDTNVIESFEESLQLRYVARTPWADVRASLIEASPFLQGKPMSWAERIVRTETMAASNASNLETIKGAEAELGDMVKILSATFDARTSADSYDVHGQIRRPSEAFVSWFGAYMHPPNRPNDRETVVPHRISWPIPAALAPKSDGDVASRWVYEGRKGSPPGRSAPSSTVDRALFGKTAPPKIGAPVTAQVPEQIETKPEVKPEVKAKPEPEVQAPTRERPRRVTRDTRERTARSALDALVVQHRGENPRWFAEEVLPEASGRELARFTKEHSARSEREVARIRATRRADLPRPTRVQLSAVRSMWMTVDVPETYQAISDRGNQVAETPIVHRLGRTLYVNDRMSHNLLTAARLEGRHATPVHVVDLNAPDTSKVAARAAAAAAAAEAARAEAAREAAHKRRMTGTDFERLRLGMPERPGMTDADRGRLSAYKAEMRAQGVTFLTRAEVDRNRILGRPVGYVEPPLAPPPPPPAPPASPGKKIKAANVDVDFVGLADIENEAKAKGVSWYGTGDSIKKVFKSDRMPSIESMSKVWGRDNPARPTFEHTDATGKKEVLPTKVTINMRRVSVGDRSASWSGAIVNGNGETIGNCARDMTRHSANDLEMHHSLFKVEPQHSKYMGGGAGEAMFRQSILTYKEMGVTRITTDPHWIGRYTWATFGYDWDEHTAERRRGMLASYLMQKLKLSATEANNEVRSLRHSWEFADYDYQGQTVTDEVNDGTYGKYPVQTNKAGKAFMLHPGHPPWSGELNLADENSPSFRRAKSRVLDRAPKG